MRLCALVPPRGFHMVRYHGMFAPHARGRFALTGRGMHDCATAPSGKSEQAAPTAAMADVPRGDASPPVPGSASTPARSTAAQPAARKGEALHPPDDATRARRLEWSLLMKRAFVLDVLCCPRCQGSMRLIAVID